MSNPVARLLRLALTGTPGRMRIFALAAACCCLLFGVLSGIAAASSLGAVERARHDTAQVVRAQKIATNLLAADATASTSYLVGGAETATVRSHYDRQLAEADALISAAAAAQPADQQALGRLNVEITAYAASIEHARADNRQGLVVGQQYQRLASDGLRQRALPLVDAIVTANTTRLGSTGAGETTWPQRQAWLQAAVLVIGVVGLAVFAVWLAYRTRRRFNVPVTIAFVVVLLAGVLGLFGQLLTVSRLANFSAGPMEQTMLAAEGRRALYDARASESLDLITRSSERDYEKSWEAAMVTVSRALADHPQDNLGRYTRTHQQVVALDREQGRWASAVALSTDAETSGFTALDAQVSQLSDANAEQATAALRSHRLLSTLQWLLPVAGGLAAFLVFRGVEQRLADYR